MKTEERKEKITKFLKKWNEMMDAACEIDDFKWKFSISITSNNDFIDDRTAVINGINDSFTNHDMTWSSNG